MANSGSDDSEPQTTPWESADEDSDQSLEQMYKQSLNGTIPVKSEPEAENTAVDDGDEEEEEEENEDNDADRNAEEEKDSDAETSTSDAMTKSMVRMIDKIVRQFVFL